jgi:hypothetical protein
VPPGASDFANGPKKKTTRNLQMDPKSPQRVVNTGHSVLVAEDAFGQEPDEIRRSSRKVIALELLFDRRSACAEAEKSSAAFQ